VESGSARRGVNLRLFAAVGSLFLTVVCVVGILVGGTSTMGIIAAFSIGFVAFNAGIALLLAARREESLHMLANDGSPRLLAAEPDGTDGSV
jgi:hypothetical protein